MKEVMLRFTSGRYRDLVLLFAVVVLGQTFTLHSEVKSQPPIKEVNITPVSASKEEVVETKILTDDELSKLYTCQDDIGEDRTVEFCFEDAQLLMQIARAEGGESLEGQKWVMGVILNRLNDGTFGDSIYKIVSAKGQFEVFSSGAYKKADVNTNSHLALAEIESGWNETEGALYFESSCNSSKSWHKQNRTFIREVDGNIYYR